MRFFFFRTLRFVTACAALSAFAVCAFGMIGARATLARDDEHVYAMVGGEKSVECGNFPVATMVSKFATYYGASSINRKHNVWLAASKLNGVTVGCEDEFSFNDTVGARTEKNGYKIAKVIFDGEYVDGVGGGVCQVSTTLYNAALLSGAAIVEVHGHTLVPCYVQPSFDAMVSSYADLRFVNTSPYEMLIKAYANGNYITVEIWGVKYVEVTRRFETVRVLPSLTEYEEDENADIGTETVKKEGVSGLISNGWVTYRDVSSGIETTVLARTDRYASQKRVVAIGTRSNDDANENGANENEINENDTNDIERDTAQ